MDVKHVIKTEHLKALTILLMVSDPTPLNENEDTLVNEALDALSREYGFDNWIEAFHKLGDNGHWLTGSKMR